MAIQRIIAASGSLAVAAGLALASTPAEAVSPRITFNSLGTHQVDTGFALKGTLFGTGKRNNKKIVLQRNVGGTWVRQARLFWQDDGPYSFGTRSYSAPGTFTFRTVVKRAGAVLDVSPTRTVTIVSDGGPPPPPPPPPPSGNDLLPDLGVKRLNDCSAAEKAKTPTGTCFSIDTTEIPGKKLLEFPATTYNVGTGPAEVQVQRSNSTSDDWQAVQAVLTESGGVRKVPITASFDYAGDGHTHWHIRDFDAYQLLDSTGAVLKLGEKHGFCLQDNVSFRGWLDDKLANPSLHPGMPLQEVYTDATACGFQDPNATDFVQGLSLGWGDTYPSSLGNQHIDITGVPDGTYVVRVIANQVLDGQPLVHESNPNNNVASSTITIAGDSVTWLSDDSGM